MEQNSSPAGVDPGVSSVGDDTITEQPPERQDSVESAETPSEAGSVLPGNSQVGVPQPPANLGRDLVLYTLARIGLFVVLTAILTLAHVPLLVSLVIAVIVALPLAMLLFRGWSARISAGVAARGAARKAVRDQFRARLSGEFDSDDSDEESQK